MRYKIWDKDDYFEFVSDGGRQRIDMAPAVVRWGEKPLPLVWQYHQGSPPLGEVTDIRLDYDKITGEVRWFKNGLTDETFDHDILRIGGYYLYVEKNFDGDRVLGAELKGVSVIPKANTPGYPRRGI